MSYHCTQFRQLIETVLSEFDHELADPVAIKLLLGTAAQESHLGHYLKQVKGPAIGAFQMEPTTFDWLVAHFSDKYPELEARKAEEMEYDLRLAIIMARLRYRVVPLPLPDDNLDEIAAYWKRHFNTPLGAGTIAEFTENYIRFVT